MQKLCLLHPSSVSDAGAKRIKNAPSHRVTLSMGYADASRKSPNGGISSKIQ